MKSTIQQVKNTSGHPLATKCLQAAKNCIGLARQEGFSDHSLLKKSATYSMRALALDPQLVEAYLMVAYLAALVGQYEEALDVISQAEELAPTLNKTKVLKADILKLSKQASPVKAIPEARNTAKPTLKKQPASSTSAVKSAQAVQAFKMDLLEDQTQRNQSKHLRTRKMNRPEIKSQTKKTIKEKPLTDSVEGFTLFNFD